MVMSLISDDKLDLTIGRVVHHRLCRTILSLVRPHTHVPREAIPPEPGFSSGVVGEGLFHNHLLDQDEVASSLCRDYTTTTDQSQPQNSRQLSADCNDLLT